MTLKLPIQEICNKYSVDKISMPKLADEYSCDKVTIRNLLLKNNIKIRSNSEAIKLAYKNDPTFVIRKSESMKLTHENDPTLRENHSKDIKQLYIDDPTLVERTGERTRQAYINDPLLAENHSEYMIQMYVDDPTIAEKRSATYQGQIYPDEWTGFVDRGRSHLIPTSRCLQLNPWFEGCVRHHIMIGVIIHIPVDLHRSVQHRMPNCDRENKNMKEINKLAFKYLLGEL